MRPESALAFIRLFKRFILSIDLRWGGGALERSGSVTEGPQT